MNNWIKYSALCIYILIIMWVWHCCAIKINYLGIIAINGVNVLSPFDISAHSPDSAWTFLCGLIVIAFPFALAKNLILIFLYRAEYKGHATQMHARGYISPVRWHKVGINLFITVILSAVILYSFAEGDGLDATLLSVMISAVICYFVVEAIIDNVKYLPYIFIKRGSLGGNV